MKKLLTTLLLLTITFGISNTITAQKSVSQTMKKLEFREEVDYYIQNLPAVKYRCNNSAYGPYIVVSKAVLKESDFQSKEQVLTHLKGKEFEWQIALKVSLSFKNEKTIYYIKNNSIVGAVNKELFQACKLKKLNGYTEITETEIDFILGEAINRWEEVFEDY